MGGIDEASAAAEQRERERQQGEERRPPAPDWIVQLSIVLGARPSRSTRAGATSAGKRQRVIAALADRIRACIHCRPDTELGVLG
ncbi:DUF6233 domain-containing protein [Streptomyces sp. NBC_01727]|uniref:DUF6233 domain-containing protein n=1 Tax=Streptomyces sp. NBC_01727 TaxID=2975924 RepID=UPI002E0E36F1|nr:DUF6233 domain-containing protein [Streptomyces sp. NBC_01727]